MIFLIIWVILVIILIFAIISRNKEKNIANKSINSINEFIKNNNINVTRYVDIPDGVKGSAKFIVDEQNKKVWYIKDNVDSENFIKSLDFKDVYKVELIKDSKVKLVESQFSIFDTYNKKEYVKKFGLRISFNDLSFTHLDILFLNSLTGQTLFGLNNVVNSTNSWIQIMNIVIERGKEERAC